MKTISAIIVSALVLSFVQNAEGASDERRSLRGTQINRQVLRLTPGITKDANRYVDRTEDGIIDPLGGSD